MSELECLRECGKIHRQLKCELKDYIQPGMKAIDVVNYIESQINSKVNNSSGNHLMGGVAFPTGFSINNCAAHWTPEKEDNTIITEDDLIKVDFGIHRNGYIIDSAYTHSFDGKYENLIEASKEANRVAIKNSGVDAILGEIGRDVKETIESYEETIKNKVRYLTLFAFSTENWKRPKNEIKYLVEKNLISDKVLNDSKMGKVFKNALQEVFDIELNQYVLKEEE